MDHVRRTVSPDILYYQASFDLRHSGGNAHHGGKGVMTVCATDVWLTDIRSIVTQSLCKPRTSVFLPCQIQHKTVLQVRLRFHSRSPLNVRNATRESPPNCEVDRLPDSEIGRVTLLVLHSRNTIMIVLFLHIGEPTVLKYCF